jgi:hypothetical protein
MLNAAQGQFPVSFRRFALPCSFGGRPATQFSGDPYYCRATPVSDPAKGDPKGGEELSSAKTAAGSIENMSFYSYGATISPTALQRVLGLEDFRDGESFLKKYAHINLFRSIADDGVLAEAIASELNRRSVEIGPLKNHIVLIGEWDTVYGRTLPQTIATALDKNCVEDCDWIHRRTYERGLDGSWPSQTDPKADPSKGTDESKSTNKENAKTKSDAEAFDRPYGQGQQDYLRRIAKSLKKQEDNPKHGASLAAVGILGSDVFDKLLVIRALKPQFPNALFFTTDLDLTLTLPSERDWTRNLVVASSFGPELTQPFQGNIPPFRGSYQTSAFLATRLAIAELKAVDGAVYPDTISSKLKAWLTPQIFEIDRHGDVIAFKDGSKPTVRPDCMKNLLDCVAVHPPYSPNQPKGLPWLALALLAPAGMAFGAWAANWSLPLGTSAGQAAGGATRTIREELKAAVLLLSLTIIFLLAPLLLPGELSGWAFGLLMLLWLAAVFFVVIVLERGQNRGLLNLTAPTEEGAALILHTVPATEFSLSAFTLLTTVLVCLFWPQVAAFLSAEGDGEPLSVFGGVSLWPVIILRFLTLLLTIGLLMRGLRKLNGNLIEIAVDMGLAKPGGVLNERQAKKRSQGSFGRTLGFLHSIPEMFRTRKSFHSKTPEYVIEEKWEDLVFQGRWAARLVRVFTYVAGMFLAFVGLAGVFGWPNVPARDPIVRMLYSVVSLADVALMLALVFFVVDATRSFWLFVRQLGAHQTTWPKKTKERYEANLGVEATDGLLDYWIDLEFIAKRTRCIGDLIYYPFIVIAIMIISRNPVFANFAVNLPILITLGLSISILLFCAFALRRAAEDARSVARKKIAEAIIRAKASSSQKVSGKKTLSAEQLEALFQHVDELQEGAFLPFSQQPPVRAILLPLAGTGLAILSNLRLIPGL